MGENLGLAIGEDQRQFVREPFPVMQDFRPIFLLFFPMVREFDRSPVCDVTIFSFAEDSVEHSRGTEETYMATMQRRERPAADVSVLGEKHSACLAVGCRIEQQVLHFVEWNTSMSERHWPGVWNFVSDSRRLAQGFKIGFRGQHVQPAHGVKQRRVSQMLVALTPDAEEGNLLVQHTRWVCQPVHRQIGEVLAQDPRADS